MFITCGFIEVTLAEVAVKFLDKRDPPDILPLFKVTMLKPLLLTVRRHSPSSLNLVIYNLPVITEVQPYTKYFTKKVTLSNMMVLMQHS